MGKVFTPPASIQKPTFNVNEDMKVYFAAQNTYVEKVSEFAKEHGKGKLAGEEIRFQVGDGYARYIVYSTSPVVLLHLPVGDAWQYPYANRLTASDIKTEVAHMHAINKLFSKAVSA